MELNKNKNKEKLEFPLTIPMIPVRDMVACPYLVSPILVGRPSSIRALEEAQDTGKLIFIATQRKEQTDDPKQKDLYQIGTVARILQLLRQDETVSVLVEGLVCADIMKTSSKFFTMATVGEHTLTRNMTGLECGAMRRAVFKLYSEYVSKHPRLSEELMRSLGSEPDDVKFFYLVVGNLFIRNDEKMKLLECGELKEGFRKLLEILSRETELLAMEHKILDDVKHRIDDQQKSYFLNEQIKAIEKELGKRGGRGVFRTLFEHPT